MTTSAHLLLHRVIAFQTFVLLIAVASASPIGSQLTFEEHEAALARGETEHVTHPQEHDTCDKTLCASIVSYCLIQESCSCDTSRNCSCCHECAICLSSKFEACSDCVGIREKSSYSNVAANSHIEQSSEFEDLEEPSPELFSKWTDQHLPSVHYSIYRYPNVEKLTSNIHHHHHQHHKHEEGNGLPNVRRRFTSQDYELALRKVDHRESSNMICTAAYFDRCMDQNECREGCRSMGANMFGWFQSGCCGCFGSACSLSNYDTFRPKCRKCVQ